MKHVFTSTEDPPESTTVGNERGQSEVIGVILVIAIVVILAALVGQAVFGLDLVSADAEIVSPQVTFDPSVEPGGENLTIGHQSGSTARASSLRIVGSESGEILDGSEIESEVGEEWESGESITIDGDRLDDSGETIRIVWESPNTDDTSILLRYDYRPDA
jgi:flagellin-like protein